jgi:uncharacterized protein (TIRG00374 family)
VTICVRLLRPRYLLWLAVPLLLLWALHTVSLQDTWTVLARLDPTHILLLIAANGLVLLTLSGRWWLILRAQGYPISYMALAGYRLAAYGVSYFTPGPQFGGEPLQVHFVQRRHRVPPSTAIAAVTLDKSLELVANFTFLAGGITLILQGQVFPGVVGRQSILLPLVLLSLPVGFLLAIWAGGHPIARLWGGGGRLFSWQRWLVRTGWFVVYQEAYQAIRAGEEQTTRFCRESPLTLVQALLVSMVSWMAIAAEYWLALHVLGLNPTPLQSIYALTAARMAFLLPFPGGLGALEASQVLALGALGMSPAAGISLSLLIRVRDVVLGGLGLWWGGASSLSLK